MNIQARSGERDLPGMSGGAGRHGQRKGPLLPGMRVANGPGAATGALAEPGPEGGPRPALRASHFIGSLLIASSAGFIGCVAALLVEISVWQSLAVYVLTGTSVFAFLLTVQNGLQPAD
jgi:hypothetical protein